MGYPTFVRGLEDLQDTVDYVDDFENRGGLTRSAPPSSESLANE